MTENKTIVSTKPISKERLNALIKLYERADDTSLFNYEHDTATALRDYARLRRWLDSHFILVHVLAFGSAAALGLVLCLFIGWVRGDFQP